MKPTDQGPRLTPMLKQYFGVKRRYPDALLFFRMGDFFELFYEDAKVAARVLGIALTSRSKEADMPMAGVPVRSVDSYLHRLIRAGHTVVICDQVQDPREASGIVERAVTRIVTAGTILEDALLEGDRHNYLGALALPAEGPAGSAWLDLSTGRFEGTSVPRDEVRDHLGRRSLAELLLPESLRDALPAELAFLTGEDCGHPTLTFRPDHEFDAAVAHRDLCRHFRVGTLQGFGIEAGDALVPAAAAVLAYVRETQQGVVEHVRRLQRWTADGTMYLDPAARQALELTETSRERRREGSLLWCLDRTRTAAGARLLRDWIVEPLTDREGILERQDAVAELVEANRAREELQASLKGIFDIERITSRLALNRTSPRDLANLRDSLRRLPELRAALAECRGALLARLREQTGCPDALTELLEQSLEDAPPLSLKDGGILRAGFSSELDELRRLRFHSKETLADLQRREIEATGITNLKVGFHSVFGYYLEVSQGNRGLVPERYVRKQTLKNCERFVTPELKDLEGRLLSADERMARLEVELFEEVRRKAAAFVEDLQRVGAALAYLDALASLAQASRDHGYQRPTLEDSTDLEIEQGYHPVLALTLGRDAFVPNDTRLGGGAANLALITGPNMAGKSTYLRQTALVVLMAQMGSFVPARRARIGIVDRVFTRVGASDDLSRGASTFMVEMTETANILHHATARSLVVLDEIGRGTGTFDGLSLARALAEHLAETVGCRTLFATHYHQLTQLANELRSVQNLSVAVREWGDEILFLYRIVPGGTDRSYGLHVARLAGIPGAVVARAAEILRELETLSPELRRKTSLEGAGQAARPPEPPRVPAPSPSRRRSRRTPAGPGLFDQAG